MRRIECTIYFFKKIFMMRKKINDLSHFDSGAIVEISYIVLYVSFVFVKKVLALPCC
jgi:hypothetical protein